MFEVSPHVHQLLRTRRPEPGRYHTGSDGYALHGPEDGPDSFTGSSFRGEPGFFPVAEDGPDRDGAEWAGVVVGGGVRVEGDADDAVSHLADEVVGGDGKFEEEGGFEGETVVLDGEPNVGVSVAEDGADYH